MAAHPRGAGGCLRDGGLLLGNPLLAAAAQANGPPVEVAGVAALKHFAIRAHHRASCWVVVATPAPQLLSFRGFNSSGASGSDRCMVPVNDDLFISGNNLTANKARLLLMAALLKLGAPPPAVDPCTPTSVEIAAVKAKLAEYQAIFDTH